MKKISYILGLLIFISWSCQSESKKVSDVETESTIDDIIIAIEEPSLIDSNSVLLESFKITECLKGCGITTEVKLQKQTGNKLMLEIGAHLNCCGKFKGDISLNNDTLNLICTAMPNDEGLVEACECHCYYNLTYKLSNIDSIPSVLLINGTSFKQNQERSSLQLLDE